MISASQLPRFFINVFKYKLNALGISSAPNFNRDFTEADQGPLWPLVGYYGFWSLLTESGELGNDTMIQDWPVKKLGS